MARGRVGQRTRVLEWCRAQRAIFTNAECAYELRLSPKNAGQLLSRLLKQGAIRRLSIGNYVATTTVLRPCTPSLV